VISRSNVDASASRPGSAPAARLHPSMPACPLPEGAGRDGWIHELKHDGFRVIALKDGDEVPGP
jgi:ATP-dependent DNA ligase